MVNLVYAAGAAPLWVLVLWRIDKVRRPGAERSLWFVLAMLACAITVDTDGPRRLADHALAAVGGAAWVWTCCAVLAAAGARSLVVHTRAGRQDVRSRRLHLAVAAAALAVVTLSFVFTPSQPALHHASAALLQRAPFYAGTVQSVARWSVWLAFVTWALVGMAEVTAEAAGHADRATPGRLATGLRLGALGCTIGYGYVALKVVVVAAWALGVGPQLLVVDQIAIGVAFLSIALIASGATYDAGLARARAGVRTAGQLRALRRLGPLWSVLYQAAPRSAATLTTSGIRPRLSRRVLEIRDRQLALRPYVGPDAPRRALESAQAAGYRGEQAKAVAEAAWLEAARLAKAAGSTPIVDQPYDPVYEVSGGQSLDEEVRWLLLVAHAHARSTLVRTFAAGAPPGAVPPQDAGTGTGADEARAA